LGEISFALSWRKAVTLPDGTSVQVRAWYNQPTPMQLALVRGHRWLAILDDALPNHVKLFDLAIGTLYL
jgi:hypothetical protein